MFSRIEEYWAYSKAYVKGTREVRSRRSERVVRRLAQGAP